MLSSKHLLILSLLAPALQAGQNFTATSHPQQTAFLELYTSEGCSSCPPADRWLSQVVDDQELGLNVLALAFHVDYWDYIGWKDPYADPQYTKRQRQLGKKNRMSTIYTPGFFINTREARNTRSMIGKLQPDQQSPSPLTLHLNVSKEPHQLTAKINSPDSDEKNARVQFIVFEDKLSSDVNSGENAGHTLSHQHVVRYLSPPLALNSSTSHTIPVKNHWDLNNQGIAAVVKSVDGEYQQSVQLRFSNFEPAHK